MLGDDAVSREAGLLVLVWRYVRRCPLSDLTEETSETAADVGELMRLVRGQIQHLFCCGQVGCEIDETRKLDIGEPLGLCNDALEASQLTEGLGWDICGDETSGEAVTLMRPGQEDHVTELGRGAEVPGFVTLGFSSGGVIGVMSTRLTASASAADLHLTQILRAYASSYGRGFFLGWRRHGKGLGGGLAFHFQAMGGDCMWAVT